MKSKTVFSSLSVLLIGVLLGACTANSGTPVEGSSENQATSNSRDPVESGDDLNESAANEASDRLTTWREISIIEGPIENWMKEQCGDVADILNSTSNRIDKASKLLSSVRNKSPGSQIAFIAAGKVTSSKLWVDDPDLFLKNKFALAADKLDPRLKESVGVEEEFENDLVSACNVADEWDAMRIAISGYLAFRAKFLASAATYSDPNYKDTYTESCLAMANEIGNPARDGNSLHYEEDDYINAGDIWVSFNLVNYCGQPVRGFEYRLTLTDAFGDQIFTASGKIVSNSVISPGKSFKMNRNGERGVFGASGSRWFDITRWWDSPKATDAGWEMVITRVLFD